MAKNVYVTRRIPDRGIDMLKQAPEIGTLDINPDDRPLTREELLSRVTGRDGVLCLLTDAIGEEVFEAASQAVVFANYAVGFNNVDLDAATRHGVAITNTPDVLTDASATHTWALMLAVTRRIVEGDRLVREGRCTGWGPLMLLGGDITGSTLGLVGCGRIATEVVRRASGFRMEMLYSDPVVNEAAESLGARRVDWTSSSCGRTSFRSTLRSINESTHHLIGAGQLALMKSSAYLINTARGPLVDEAALVTALRDRSIAGAALDVYEDEPALAAGLAELDNVVLAPHTASATLATRSKMAEMAATNLVTALRGERPPHLVNGDVWAHRRGR